MAEQKHTPRLFIVRFADGSAYPEFFATKREAKKVRDAYSTPSRPARVSRGPDPWRKGR